MKIILPKVFLFGIWQRQKCQVSLITSFWFLSVVQYIHINAPTGRYLIKYVLLTYLTWFNNITYLILVFCCCLRNVLMHLYKYFSWYICTYILYTFCGHEKYFFKASGFFKKLIKPSKRSESDQYIIMTLSEKNVRNCTRLLDFRNVCSVRVLGNW